MKHIYCISGLGADERVFLNLKFRDYKVHYIKWIIPQKNESIEAYATRLAKQIQHERPVLIGLSFGGMMCIEIAKQVQAECVIIISSIKFSEEIPYWMKLSGMLRLNKMIPIRSYKLIEPIENYNLGVKTKREQLMVQAYRKNIDPVYLEWAVNAVLNWKNKVPVKNVFHIHGDKDKIFSIKKIKADHVIQGGGHLMIMNRSEEVNKCINTILEKF